MYLLHFHITDVKRRPVPTAAPNVTTPPTNEDDPAGLMTDGIKVLGQEISKSIQLAACATKKQDSDPSADVNQDKIHFLFAIVGDITTIEAGTGVTTVTAGLSFPC